MSTTLQDAEAAASLAHREAKRAEADSVAAAEALWLAIDLGDDTAEMREKSRLALRNARAALSRSITARAFANQMRRKMEGP